MKFTSTSHGLDFVLQNQDFIISDTNITDSINPSITESIYPSQTYGSLDNALLKKHFFNMDIAEKWLKKPSVKTTEKITLELKALYEILKSKDEFLRKKFPHNLNGLNKKNNKAKYLNQFVDNNPKYAEIEDENRRLLSELVFLSKKIYEKSEKVQLQKNSELAKYILAIEILEDSLSIKKSNYKNTNNFNLRTDEEIVGHAVYESIYNDRKVGVVSSDFDIMHLTAAASLSIPDFKKENMYVYIFYKNNLKGLHDKDSYNYRKSKFIEIHGKNNLDKAKEKVALIFNKKE